MKKFRIICLIMCITMLTAGFITPINAEEDSYGDIEAPIIQLFIISDGDFITIGDEDVIGELELNINQLGNQVILLNSKINDAQETANVAFVRSGSALSTALNNQGVLQDHDQTLVLEYDQLTDTVEKLWILRNETVAFEKYFLKYEDKTDATLDEHGDNINTNFESAEFNKEDIEFLQNDVDRLQTNLSFMYFIFLLIGGGFVLFITYVLSKRYYANKKDRVKTVKRQPTLADYSPSVSAIKKAKKRKAHIRVRKIRVNKRKSPIRAAKHKRISSKVEKLNVNPISTKRKPIQIKRNPERSPLRFMFSFFHKL